MRFSNSLERCHLLILHVSLYPLPVVARVAHISQVQEANLRSDRGSVACDFSLKALGLGMPDELRDAQAYRPYVGGISMIQQILHLPFGDRKRE